MATGCRAARPRNLRLTTSAAAVFAAVGLVTPVGASDFPPVVKLSSLDGSNDFWRDGGSSEEGSGASVHSAGDINGDGFTDLIIGAVGADPGGKSYAGSSYVVFGKAAG